MKLYKTTIVIWSEYDGSKVELEALAREATQGNSYCSKQSSDLVDVCAGDPDWDGTDFFKDPIVEDLTPIVGQRYIDSSHPNEPEFMILELPDDDAVAELDTGGWYELGGPTGFLAKLNSGVIRPVGDPVDLGPL